MVSRFNSFTKESTSFSITLFAMVMALFIAGFNTVASAQVNSVQDGLWKSNSTWSKKSPGKKDNVVIKHTIIVDIGNVNKANNVSFGTNNNGTPKLVVKNGNTLKVSGDITAANGSVEVNGTLEVSGNVIDKKVL